MLKSLNLSCSELQILDVRFQLLETHPCLFNWLTAGIATQNSHPNPGHAILLRPYLHTIIFQNVVLSRGSLHDRERRMQQAPACGSQMDTFNMMVPESK
jgi:hypothetical protein